MSHLAHQEFYPILERVKYVTAVIRSSKIDQHLAALEATGDKWVELVSSRFFEFSCDCSTAVPRKLHLAAIEIERQGYQERNCG